VSNPAIEAIMANLKTTLAGITVAAGFNTTVATVERVARNSNEADANPKPWIGLVKMAAPKPIAYPFGQYRCTQPIAIFGYIEESNPETKAAKLAKLEDDIIAAIHTDPTRGGVAITTGLAGLSETDEAQPSSTETVGALSIQIEVIYDRTTGLTP